MSNPLRVHHHATYPIPVILTSRNSQDPGKRQDMSLSRKSTNDLPGPDRFSPHGKHAVLFICRSAGR